MASSHVLSFISKPENPAKSVYDRLYLDFSKRNIESKTIYPSSSMSRSVVSFVPAGKIEDLLMQKQVAAKSKLKVLKARYQAEEMKEVKQAPEINEISRILAEKANGKTRENKSAYIKSILSVSRFTKNNREQLVKTANIRLDDLEYRSAANKSPNCSQKKEKNLYLEQLRNAVVQKHDLIEPEEPPSLLEMSVVDRGNYWIGQKVKKIKKIEKEMTERGMDGCTFAPLLTPRMNTSRTSSVSRAKSVNTSYSQLFQYKKLNQNLNSTKNSIKSIKSPSAKPALSESKQSSLQYYQLSPHNRKFGYKAGLNLQKFISKARPMVRYSSVKYFN